MTTTCTGCIRCGCRDLAPMRPDDAGAYQEASDRTESVVANLECAKCHFRFRYVPGTREVPGDREVWP